MVGTGFGATLWEEVTSGDGFGSAGVDGAGTVVDDAVVVEEASVVDVGVDDAITAVGNASLTTTASSPRSSPSLSFLFFEPSTGLTAVEKCPSGMLLSLVSNSSPYFPNHLH